MDVLLSLAYSMDDLEINEGLYDLELLMVHKIIIYN